MSFPVPIVSRQAWRARTALPRTLQAAPLEAFLHHTESHDAAKIVTLAQALAQVRNIQDYHMDVKGWSDIGYHVMVFQPSEKRPEGTVVACRPVQYEPAAQLSHNDRTLAIAVYGNGDADELHRHTRYLIECIVRKFGADVRKVGGHRDVVNTDCPGAHFYAQVPTIAGALGLKHF